MTSDLKLLEQRIIDLEAENAEIPELRKKFAEVEDKNAKLETENFEIKAEIMKLRAELKSGIEELEKSRTDTVAESARRDIESDKLKARVAKLEQDSRQPQDDSPFEEAFSVPESVAVQLKKHMPFGENVEPEALPEVVVTASPSLCEEDRKTDEFLDLVKRKEKLQHETAENPKDQEAPMISQNISSVKNVPILDDQQKVTYLEEGCFGRTESEQNDELIPLLEKNLIVEHELIQQLSTTINNDEVSSIFRRNTGSVDLDPSLVSAQSIVHMFREAIRSGQNAILCWYHFTEKYDKRIVEVSVDKKVKGSDKNDDYYEITNESLYLLCKLNHNEENDIEGRYEIGFYNLKCKQHRIEIK
ncbi:14367_t:CDS:2, partial [Cetraspora pellucida]